MNEDKNELLRNCMTDPSYVGRTIKINGKETELSEYIGNRIIYLMNNNELKNYYVITGFPGVGKTTLARHIGSKLYEKKRLFPLHIVLHYYNQIRLPCKSTGEEENKLYPPELSINTSKFISSGGYLRNENFENFKKNLGKLINTIASTNKLDEKKIQSLYMQLQNIVEEPDKTKKTIIEIAKVTGLLTSAILGTNAIDMALEILDFLENHMDKVPEKNIMDILSTLTRGFQKKQNNEKLGILVIIDNITSRNSKLALHIKDEILSEEYNRNKSKIFVLLVGTIDETIYMQNRGRTRSAIAQLLNGLREEEIGIHSLGTPIPPPSLGELEQILKTSIKGIDKLNEQGQNLVEIIRKYSICTGGHLSLILTFAKIIVEEKHKEKQLISNPLKYCSKTDSNNIKIIYRFTALPEILEGLANIDQGIIGLMLQPMGISKKEIEHLCNDPCLKNILRKLGITQTEKGDCGISLDKNNLPVFYQGLIEHYWEKWMNDNVIAIRPGTYLNHIPMLLRELEIIAQQKEWLEQLVPEEFDESHRQNIVRELKSLAEQVGECRAALARIHSTLLKRSNSIDNQ